MCSSLFPWRQALHRQNHFCSKEKRTDRNCRQNMEHGRLRKAVQNSSDFHGLLVPGELRFSTLPWLRSSKMNFLSPWWVTMELLLAHNGSWLASHVTTYSFAGPLRTCTLAYIAQRKHWVCFEVSFGCIYPIQSLINKSPLWLGRAESTKISFQIHWTVSVYLRTTAPLIVACCYDSRRLIIKTWEGLHWI